MKADEAADLTMRHMNREELDVFLLKIREAAIQGKTHLHFEKLEPAHKVWLINNGYWFGIHRGTKDIDGKQFETIEHYITWFKLQV